MKPVLQGWLYGGLFGVLFLAGCMEQSRHCSCPNCSCQSPVMQSRMRDAAATPGDNTKAATTTAAKPADKASTLTKAETPKTLPKSKPPLTVKPADSLAAAKSAPKPAPTPPAPMKVVDVKADKAVEPAPTPVAPALDKTPAVVPVSLVASRPEAPRATLVDSDGSKAHGHAPDYTWLVGELQFSYVRKAWRLRYMPVDEDDRYGGSVTFIDTGALPMANYQSGQIIRVEGRLRDPEAREPSPAYLVKSIQVLR
jgi:hypothetical protein